MNLPLQKARSVAHLLVEGNSIRSAQRITGVHKKTIMKLLGYLGRGCDTLLRRRVRGVSPDDLELDEIWTFVRKKQRRVKPSDDPRVVGDAYCFIALDRATRLVVAWHLGKRDEPSTARFITRVRDATVGKYQISSDAFPAYEGAIRSGLHDRAAYARIVKVIGPDHQEAVMGNPDLARLSTTYIERKNGTLRQWSKRFTRLTYAFSKKWENLASALALHFAYYNFCHVHRTLHVTPAMAADLAQYPWSIDELLSKAVLSG